MTILVLILVVLLVWTCLLLFFAVRDASELEERCDALEEENAALRWQRPGH
ncbi:MAG TPA: hypothetical protein VGY48_12465 [Vicinamibacterales bacterium]|jgi:hypothetical protein|nr:hypothetical protein [Vicinamibacterales bacterium]